jgi:hypothetical protein
MHSMRNWFGSHHWIVRTAILLMLFICFLIIAESALTKKKGPKKHNHSTQQQSSSEQHKHGNAQSDDKEIDSREGIRQILESPVFAEFSNWANSYRTGKDQLERGRELSLKRRELFKELIKLDPRSALERAVPIQTRQSLPASVTQNLEEPVSGYGDFMVLVVMLHDMKNGDMAMTGSRIQREVVIKGARFKGYVYGRREAMTTKLNIPLQGTVLDGMMAVDESFLRVVNPQQYAASNVEFDRVDEHTVIAEVGGELVYFSNEPAVDNFVRDQIEWETKIGPERAQSPWTEGAKTVLFIRADFSDKPGEPMDWSNQPLTPTRAQNLISNEVSPFYVNNSYNKTSLQTTVTSVVRLPQPQSYYFDKTGELFTDGANAARNAGFDPDNYNLYIVAMSSNQGFSFGGLAYIGAKGTILNGSFGLSITAHELGHNYGLLHANLWRTTDGTVIGTGSNVEYGNPFDVMGSGFDARGHFSAHYKRRLDWLSDANIQNITTDGVYRVFAHDSTIPGGIRTLKIRKNASKNYWIEFRQLFFTTPEIFNGAVVYWDYASLSFREIQILDMTPNTNTTAVDAPLMIGQTFDDTENRIRLTVIGKNGTTPESLDVRVEFNVGCTFSLSQSSQNFTGSGGEGSVPLNTLSGCRPITSSNSSWITPIAGDSAPVRYIVAANYTGQARSGTLTVAGQTFTVQQSAATTACSNRPAGLVGWWRGEGNALDETGMNNAAVVNSISFAGGKVGGGFFRDAANNGTIEAPDSPSLTLNRSMTFEAWLKLDAYGGSVIERRSGIIAPYQVTLTSSGLLFFIIGVGTNGAGTGYTTPNPLPLGQFVHVAATRDDATSALKLYVNGSLVRQGTIQRPIEIPAGGNPKITIGNVNGVVDELSAYSRALTAAEILAIYNAGNAGTGAAGKCLGLTGQADTDADNRADVAVFRPSNGVWYLLKSSLSYNPAQFVSYNWGTSQDRPVPGDYDGDGQIDIAIYRPSTGVWYILRSSTAFNPSQFLSFGWGVPGDVPVPGDYDGDGITDAAIFRASTGFWYILKSTNSFNPAQFAAYNWGTPNDIPAAADFDNDGKSDPAIFRTTNGVWYVLKSSTGYDPNQYQQFNWGVTGDVPVPADYDGDGFADVAIFRPSTGVWYILRSSTGYNPAAHLGMGWGVNGDVPVVADYDGDLRADVAIFRPSAGTWYILKSSTSFNPAQFMGIGWGVSTDTPVPIGVIR